MRILLIHNPKAGDRKHSKKQLMASLARCGHQAFYHSIKERGWKKAFKKPVDLIVAAGGDGTVHKTAWQIVDSGIETENRAAGKCPADAADPDCFRSLVLTIHCALLYAK